jgi:hypothetical protein
MSVWLEVGHGYKVFGEEPESYVDSRFLVQIQKVCGCPEVKVTSLPGEIPGCLKVGLVFGEKTADAQRAIDLWSSCGSDVSYAYMRPDAQAVHFCERVKSMMQTCDWVYVLVPETYLLRDFEE